MREIWISFSIPMVRAIRAKRKRMTRRLITPQPELRDGLVYWASPRYDNGDGIHYLHTDECAARRLMLTACPYGQPGDHLKVREGLVRDGGFTVYACDRAPVLVDGQPLAWRWKRDVLPSMFMPAEACRIVVPNTGVQVERLQEIREEDAIAEGVTLDSKDAPWITGGKHLSHRSAFFALWDRLNAARGHGWEKNDQVWVVSFDPSEVR